MINFLIIGTIFGLSAGFTPGPLLTLVISETLQHDIKSGIKVAFVPVISDLPIIVLTLFILVKLSNFHNVLGIITLTGGFFILFMGQERIRTNGVELNLQEIKPKPFTKGILINVLNPHVYLFWFSVGAPMVTKAMSQNIFAPLAFISGFYAVLIGSKIALAVLVGKSKSFLVGNVYIYTIRFLGLVLCILAIILFRDGLKLLGII